MHQDQDISTHQPAIHGKLSAASVVLYLLGAAAAGFAGWKIGESNRDYATVPLEISSKAYQFAELNAETVRVNSINGSLVYGGLGLCLAVGTILATKLAARGQCPPVLQSLAAFAAVVALSAAPSFVMMPAFAASADRDPGSLDLTMPLLIHLGLWAPIGAGIGLLFGILRNRGIAGTIESTLAGAVGATLGTVVFEFLGAIVMPTDKTNEPMPGTERARLAAAMCVSMGIMLSLLYSTIRSKHHGRKLSADAPVPADPA